MSSLSVKLPHPPTLADIDALPSHMKGEILDGVFYAMTRPRGFHQDVAGRVHFDVAGPYLYQRGGPGGWWVLPKPGVEFPNSPEVSPEVAGWKRERMPTTQRKQAITVVPDWVCEIHSDSTRRHDLTVKMPMYLRHGVEHVWLIEPELRTLQVCRHSPAGWLTVLHAVGDDPVRAPSFDAVELDLAALWRW